jgi:hypothetical protein
LHSFQPRRDSFHGRRFGLDLQAGSIEVRHRYSGKRFAHSLRTIFNRFDTLLAICTRFDMIAY